MNRLRSSTQARRLALGAAIAGSMTLAVAQDPGRIEKLETENSQLKARLDALEQLAQREGLQPSKTGTKNVGAMSEITLSGFVQSSYFYNSKNPADRKSDGYLWNTSHNAFSLNKVKLTLASKPVEASGEKWDAGFRASMFWGEDSTVLNTGSPNAGFEALREAFVEINAPIGTGLNIKAGQLISLLNYESGDGGAANANFSQGYQWFFTGNGPSSGVQLSYTFTDWLTARARVQNGMYAGPLDSNDGKTVIASLNFKPVKEGWFNLIGFGGPENRTLDIKGGSVLAGYDFTDKFHTGLEFDYFHFDPSVGKSSDLTSIGVWTSYDLDPTLSIAVRAEYLDDPDGGGLKGINLPGRPGSAILSSDADGSLGSLTLTLNWKPTARIKIQPEIRYDFTTYAGGLDGGKSRVIFGIGANYLF
jgi:outer membrane murein-binding lipoprotein Lpp